MAKHRRKAMPFMVAVLLLVVSVVMVLLEPKTGLVFLPNAGEETAFVQRVIDGDTLVLADGRHIRLIGIDTPEKGDACSAEATDFLKGLVSGKELRLEFDVERLDKYDRTLAYIFVDSNFLNLQIAQAGFATAFPFEPNTKYAEEFAAAEAIARERHIGCLWKAG